MSASLRHRRRPHDDEPPASANDEEMEIFVEQYSRRIAASRGAALNSTLCRAMLLILVAGVATTSVYQWRWRSADTLPSNRGDLVLLSVYPRAASPYIPEIEGRAELLVTDENKHAVEAVRAAIGLANNLRYDGSNRNRRRRKRGAAGVLLGISNLISGLVSGPQLQREGYVPGEIVLETYDEVKMRSYLLEHGRDCSKRPHEHAENEDAIDTSDNAVLLLFDQTVTEMKAAADDAKLQDALWNRAVHLFAFCKFANGHARGYIAHGTSIRSLVEHAKLHEHLERARLAGDGIMVKDHNDSGAAEGDSVHWSPLIVLPQGTASRDAAMEIVSLLIDGIHDRTSLDSKSSLLLGIDEGRLQQWSDGGADWLFLGPFIGNNNT